MLSIIKLQNLKAIHNDIPHLLLALLVVINHKTTKFESNSQHYTEYSAYVEGCYQSQNYKIWKQFTTCWRKKTKNKKMLSITKLQNLKAIHNAQWDVRHPYFDVINHKTTKFESNSQLHFVLKIGTFRCYQSQNYKIWKQFTTGFTSWRGEHWMLSITKLQNLKAIHNYWKARALLRYDVINHKTTKFESNSQLCNKQRYC